MALLSVVKGYTILHNKFAIISSPVLGITIRFHCLFCEIFQKLLGTFAILHAGRIGIRYTTGSMHHKLCNNCIQLWKCVFVWNFCTYNGVIVIYCFRLVCIITNPKYVCMRGSSFLPLNDIYQCNHFTQHRFWTVEEAMQKGFQLQPENSCNNILMIFCCLVR